jgi:hypothetical protein
LERNEKALEVTKLSGRRPELQMASLANAVLAPELVPLRRILRVRINNYASTIPTAKKKHSLHLMKLQLRLMLLPQHVAVLANQVANLAKEETPRYR